MNISTRLTEREILEALCLAQDYEFRRQFPEGMAVLKKVWHDVSEKPVTEGLSKPVQGEILLRCGALLRYYSFINQLSKNDLARDWLTEAYEIFSELGNGDKIAETQMEIAMSYWCTGSHNEAKIWIDESKSAMVSPISPVGVKIIASKLLICYSLGETEDALKLIEENEIYVDLCNDSRVKVHFYINSGLIFSQMPGYEVKALERYRKTVKFAEEVGNISYLAIAENNSGYIYRHLGMYEQAIKHTLLAVKYISELKDIGKLGPIYDTLALIYFELGELDKSMHYAEMAIEILENGEEYGFLVDTLWTKFRLLIQLGKPQEALGVFSRLYNLAQMRISEKYAKKMAQKFLDMTYFRSGNTFDEEVHNFEKKLITDAFHTAGKIQKVAAKILSLEERRFSKMLATRHADLRPELGVKLKAKRKGSKVKSRRKFNKNVELTTRKEAKTNFTYSVGNIPTTIPGDINVSVLCEIENDRLSYLGLKRGVLAVCSDIENKLNIFPAMVRHEPEDLIYCGFIDSVAGILGLLADGSEPVTLNESDCEILGFVVGFCKLNANGSIYDFYELEN